MMITTCNNCGKTNSINSKYCANCGISQLNKETPPAFENQIIYLSIIELIVACAIIFIM